MRQKRQTIKSKKSILRGFSLSELLIVVAIVALILFIALLNYRAQINKGYDARRKSDLNDIKVAFEDYYNDHGCYPPADILTICGGTGFRPYLSRIPCDPVSKLPYKYVPLGGDVCKGHRVLTTLEYLSDPVITQLGCNAITGCGFGAGYNYGVSSGVPVADPNFDPNATPTPTPTPGPVTPTPTPTPTGGVVPGDFACSPTGVCNSYADPVGKGCPITYTTVAACDAGCLDPANWCAR